MITKEQATANTHRPCKTMKSGEVIETFWEQWTHTQFHYTGRHECKRTVGPKGGVTEKITQVRRSGKTQVWKKDPARFRVPVKYGLYESGEITESNAADWHLPEDCPLNHVKE